MIVEVVPVPMRLQAEQLTATVEVTTANGVEQGEAGEWVITYPSGATAIFTAKEFEERFIVKRVVKAVKAKPAAAPAAPNGATPEPAGKV